MESLILEKKEGYAILTLNRPPVNAASLTMLQEIHDAFDLLEDDEDIRSIIITGAGKAFCAGADLANDDSFGAEGGKAFRDLGRSVSYRIEKYPKPVIAAVNGWCIGGGTGIAWPCDIRIAGESAKFRAADTYLGLLPSWGVGLVRMVHWVGRNKIMDFMVLGETFDGARAVELGVVTKVVKDEELMEEAIKAARRIAEASPLAMRKLKEAVACSYQQDFEAAKAKEEEVCAICYNSEDGAEGMRAFLEKRSPVYKGK